MDNPQENPISVTETRNHIFNNCERLTGFKFKIVNKIEYDELTKPLVQEDILTCQKGEIEYETQGTADWPLHDINWPAESEWMTSQSRVIRISAHVADCYSGVQIDSQGRLRIFHHDFASEQEADEIEKRLGNSQGENIQGFYLSGLSRLDRGAGKIYKQLGLSPLYKNTDEPEFASAGIIIDPMKREVLIAIMEDLGLRDYN